MSDVAPDDAGMNTRCIDDFFVWKCARLLL